MQTVYQIIIVLVFLVAMVLTYIAWKRFPEKVHKLIPYNFVVLGSLFCYISIANDNINKFALYSGIGFFVYGIFLLFKRDRPPKKD